MRRDRFTYGRIPGRRQVLRNVILRPVAEVVATWTVTGCGVNDIQNDNNTDPSTCNDQATKSDVGETAKWSVSLLPANMAATCHQIDVVALLEFSGSGSVNLTPGFTTADGSVFAAATGVWDIATDPTKQWYRASIYGLWRYTDFINSTGRVPTLNIKVESAGLPGDTAILYNTYLELWGN